MPKVTFDVEDLNKLQKTLSTLARDEAVGHALYADLSKQLEEQMPKGPDEPKVHGSWVQASVPAFLGRIDLYRCGSNLQPWMNKGKSYHWTDLKDVEVLSVGPGNGTLRADLSRQAETWRSNGARHRNSAAGYPASSPHRSSLLKSASDLERHAHVIFRILGSTGEKAHELQDKCIDPEHPFGDNCATHELTDDVSMRALAKVWVGQAKILEKESRSSEPAESWVLKEAKAQILRLCAAELLERL